MCECVCATLIKYNKQSHFLQSLASVPGLETITKEQPGLVEIKNVGSWITHRCYNCSMYTHAVHREYGAALVLINSNIVVSTRHITNNIYLYSYVTKYKIK